MSRISYSCLLLPSIVVEGAAEAMTGQGRLKLIHAVEQTTGDSAAHKHITTVRGEGTHAIPGIKE